MLLMIGEMLQRSKASEVCVWGGWWGRVIMIRTF